MRVLWRHFGMGVNFLVWRKARGIIKDHARRPSCYRLALMAFLAQKPKRHLRVLRRHFGMGVNFMVWKHASNFRRHFAIGVYFIV